MKSQRDASGRMSAPLRIGIIGGMGPAATVLFMERIIAATTAADDVDHIPMIVDNSPQIPSRIDALLNGVQSDPGGAIADIATRLQGYGAAALAMPCNTAHHYAREITSNTTVPFFNMVTLSVQAAAGRTPEGGKVGILASPAVRRIGLFDKALGNLGLIAIYPNDEDQILAAIKAIKCGDLDERPRSVLADAAAALADKGVSCILVACSEFSLIADAARGRVPVIDTLDVLVAHTVRFALQQYKTPITFSKKVQHHDD